MSNEQIVDYNSDQQQQNEIFDKDNSSLANERLCIRKSGKLLFASLQALHRLQL